MAQIVTLTCPQCLQEFGVFAWQAKRGRKFCGRKCASLAKTTKVIKQCKYCGKEFEVAQYLLQKGLGKYCSQKCFGLAQRKRVSLICAQCGEAFFTKAYKIGNQKFCGPKCAGLANRNRVTLVCAQCGKKFETTKSRAKAGRKFCGDVCAKQYIQGHKKLVIIICAWCGKKKDFVPWIAKKQKFCSHECYTASRKGVARPEEVGQKISKAKTGHEISQETRDKISKSRTGQHCGSNHHAWNGGSSFLPYSPEWTKELKRDIRQRDQHTCQCCGTKALSVHHIDYDKLNSVGKNLIVLCKSCHAKTNFNRDFWQDTFQVLVQFRYEAGYYDQAVSIKLSEEE